MRIHKYLKRMIVILLFLTILISEVMPCKAYAREMEHKVIRVGWYDSSFCYYDEYGRRK